MNVGDELLFGVNLNRICLINCLCQNVQGFLIRREYGNSIPTVGYGSLRRDHITYLRSNCDL